MAMAKYKKINRPSEVLAKGLYVYAVRNNPILENALHCGKEIITKTGDYSDVLVLDADGNKIPWNDAQRISEKQMKAINKDAVDRIYRVLQNLNNPETMREMAMFFAHYATGWDEPEPIQNK